MYWKIIWVYQFYIIIIIFIIISMPLWNGYTFRGAGTVYVKALLQGSYLLIERTFFCIWRVVVSDEWFLFSKV